MSPTDFPLLIRMRTHLSRLPPGPERDEGVATWKGHVAATSEWGRLKDGKFYQLTDHLREIASPDLPSLDLYSGPPGQDVEWELAQAEEHADEKDTHPEFEESYWFVRPRLRGWLRAASTPAARRAQALAWSGYAVGLQEAGLLPPGHAARLMAELAPDLRPGDPWEALVRSGGLDPAVFDPARAGPGPWQRGLTPSDAAGV